MPAFHLNHITRAVALGYLGRQKECGTIISELLQLGSGSEKSQRESKQHIWRYEQPVDLLLERLRKAFAKREILSNYV